MKIILLLLISLILSLNTAIRANTDIDPLQEIPIKHADESALYEVVDDTIDPEQCNPTNFNCQPIDHIDEPKDDKDNHDDSAKYEELESVDPDQHGTVDQSELEENPNTPLSDVNQQDFKNL